MRAAPIIIGAVIVAVMAFLIWLALGVLAKQDACEARGGVPIKSQNGPVYCLRPEVFLP